MKVKSKITHLNVDEIASKTGNIYKSVRVIGKRARQLSAAQKEELNEKLAEFASDVDNLEEVFENREQIEISRYFERLPKSTTVASEELVNDELVLSIVEGRLVNLDKGWLLDGFPRNVNQAQSLQSLLEKINQPLDTEISL